MMKIRVERAVGHVPGNDHLSTRRIHGLNSIPADNDLAVCLQSNRVCSGVLIPKPASYNSTLAEARVEAAVGIESKYDRPRARRSLGVQPAHGNYLSIGLKRDIPHPTAISRQID